YEMAKGNDVTDLLKQAGDNFQKAGQLISNHPIPQINYARYLLESARLAMNYGQLKVEQIATAREKLEIARHSNSRLDILYSTMSMLEMLDVEYRMAEGQDCRKQLSAAIEYGQQAYDINPNNPDDYGNLNSAYLAQAFLLAGRVRLAKG